MKVSIIIPTYNRSALLKDAIESLYNQDYPKDLYEIIISDNDSTDNTFETVKGFGEKHQSRLNIKYILEKRKGATFARHSGAFHSENEILCFGDDDGVYDRNWISKIVEVYKDHPEVAAVGTRIEIKWDATPPEWIKKYECLLGQKSLGEGVKTGKDIYINAGSYSIKRSVLYKMRGFGPDLVDNYLIGDGETGLNNKLFAASLFIGFTDETRMMHQQFVARNARIEDIARRFANNGIADAYGDISKTNVIFILKKVLKHLKNCIKFNIRSFCTPFVDNNDFFLYYLEKAYIRYILKYIFDYKFRKMLRSGKWVLDENYISSGVLIISRFKNGNS